ncbi:hypothetical protein [Streptomyces sp. BH055]|uniref:hypothetical protein n=2 Tax=unclassified Streptomyces TaxID=2593676 RepID=UPI003BB59C42
MDSELMAAAFLLLVTIGAYLIHRINAQPAGGAAVHTRRRFLPGHRVRRESTAHKQVR